MTLILPPRVLESTTTTGTGTLTLAGAVTGWQSFAAVGNANTCYYALWAVDADGIPTGDWEEGLGTYTSAGTTLARTTVYNSSNAGAAVNLAAGTKYVAVTRPSEGTGIFLQPGGTAGTDEVNVYHDGSNGYIEALDGELRLKRSTNFMNLSTGGFYYEASGSAKLFATNAGNGLVVASDWQFLFSSNPNVGGSGSAGLQYAAVSSVIKVTDGSTGIGSFLSAKLVEASTAGSGAPNVLTATESRTVLTNEGTTAQNYHTLPTAAAGLEFEFVVQDTDGIRVVANTDDTIRDGATVSATAGYIQSTTQGSTLRLLAINAVEWIVMSKTGTWTVDS